jgi:hypothetical protein
MLPPQAENDGRDDQEAGDEEEFLPGGSLHVGSGRIHRFGRRAGEARAWGSGTVIRKN